MAYDMFHGFGLDKIKDSLTESFDYKDNNPEQWNLVNKKSVMDSDGFYTDYCWYTNGEKHIFMLGDCDIYSPDEDYADWVVETESEAKEWFDSYNGFEEEEEDIEDDDFFESCTGNANFMNDAFERVFGNGAELED